MYVKKKNLKLFFEIFFPFIFIHVLSACHTVIIFFYYCNAVHGQRTDDDEYVIQSGVHIFSPLDEWFWIPISVTLFYGLSLTEVNFFLKFRN